MLGTQRYPGGQTDGHPSAPLVLAMVFPSQHCWAVANRVSSGSVLALPSAGTLADLSADFTGIINSFSPSLNSISEDFQT